jgi:pyridoxamine 5'-phosphate oxidase
MKVLADLRRDYARAGLAEADVDADPFAQVRRWLHEALDAGVVEPNAMTLATADASGVPSARTVLLKGLDDRGFVFFTSYESRKGRELAENPRAAIVLPWLALERQICVTGSVERVSREETADYFRQRPRMSQLGAWTSPQSQVIASRSELDVRLAEVTARFEGLDVTPPDTWGGYRLVPDAIELWQGRTSRLHDRLRYRRIDGAWTLERLAP